MEDGLARLREALRDRYRIERELGRGGMATVYLARDLRHDRPVALKVFRSELSASMGAERFLREIRLTARLDHPHILPLLDSGTAGGALFYTMPYVEGESLRERLEREKQLPLEDALRITRQVADALDHAHLQGIVHRDIKPENILLGTGHARLADFGIARAVDAAGGETLTGTGLSIGTPTYMSPEQASGDREVDARADVYSLACVVYEMLAGQPPHTGATVEAIHARKALEQPPALRVVRPALPAGVDSAIRKALAPAPADRWQNVRELLAALEHPTGAGWTRRARTRTALIAAGFVLTVAAAWWWIARGPAAGRVESLAVLPFANLSGDTE
jgi:eukaryotic-like serine/threonine-protein kinase